MRVDGGIRGGCDQRELICLSAMVGTHTRTHTDASILTHTLKQRHIKIYLAVLSTETEPHTRSVFSWRDLL